MELTVKYLNDDPHHGANLEDFENIIDDPRHGANCENFSKTDTCRCADHEDFDRFRDDLHRGAHREDFVVDQIDVRIVLNPLYTGETVRGFL